jgi:hypothetical protein
MAEVVFWVSAAGLFATYLGYPAALALWARVAPRPVRRAALVPPVSVVVAARDEAARIGARVANLLALDYPADRLAVIVVSDGSSDDTAARAAAAAAGDPRVRVITLPRPSGKAAALNAGVRAASGEVIVFADARQRFAPDAVRRLVENFADPEVGAVSGRLLLEDPHGSGVGDGLGLYWRHELWLRARESDVGSMLGATGAIYAIRRRLYTPIPDDTILDDVRIPMQAVLAGTRAVLDTRAVALDVVAPSGGHELARKVRTLYGNYQLIASCPALLSPRRNPVFGRFLAHKLARLVVPAWLVGLGASSLVLREGVYAVAAVAQAAAYAIAGVGALRAARCAAPRRGPIDRIASAAYVFVLLNWAACLALVRFVRGDTRVWAKSRA